MKETRDEIIELADRLIRTRGYNAFSYKDISSPMAVRNSAIHYYFPAKSDLGAAVADKEIKKVTLNKEYYKDLSGVAQLKKLVETFYHTRDEGMICLTGSLTPDYDTFPHSLQYKVKEMCGTILDWMSDCLEKARREKDLHFQGAASDRALLVMSSLASSLLLARVMGRETFNRMMDQVLQDMGASWRIADLPKRPHPAFDQFNNR